MKHYSIEKWADYIRGVVGEAERTEMAGHLEGNCGQCARAVARIRAVEAELLQVVEVPKSFLERARGIFPRSAAVPAVRKLTAILTFDTFAAPAPVGLRGAGQKTRRLAYAVEDFKIELLVAEGMNQVVTLTGQATAGDGQPVGPVRLQSRNKVLSSAPANEFGEFQMEIAVRSGLQLVIPCAGRNLEIEVPLDMLLQKKQETVKPSART